MDPRTYKSKRSPKTFGTNIKKDKLQIKAVKRFVKAGKPVLGLCRGCQVINVAFGGKLKQHIGWHTGFRKVKNKKGYWMYKMFGKYRTTYHYHHQCADTLPEGFIVTQTDAKDGRIEGFRHETKPIYAIQWHPDSMDEMGLQVMEIFRVLCMAQREGAQS
jgi:putative glutamine amidotransferase